MDFLEFKKLLFEVYMEYTDLQDPLEKAKMEAQINNLLEFAERNYTEVDSLDATRGHQIIGELFDLYHEYQEIGDPLEKEKYRLKINEFMKKLG